MPKVYVLILLYNGIKDLEICLPTLKNLESPSYDLKTVVVDNDSNEKVRGELKKLLARYKEIEFIETGKNLGFAGGNNVGIRHALKKGAEYVVLLNNDTKVEGNFVRRGLKLKADIISPAVKFKEFKDKPRFIYDLGGFVNWWTGRTSHFNAYRDEYLKRVSDPPLSVDYVAGCSMMIRREVLERVGLLNELYFMYFEDVDYCVSAKKKGFRVEIDPGVAIYHKLGGSIDRWSVRAIYHNLLSNYIFITRHLGIRRMTGYAYLTVLTLKIIRDYVYTYLKGKTYLKNKKMWRGAKHEYGK